MQEHTFEKRVKMEARRAPRAVIVGGSIAGLSCAHALIAAGWKATVIEKSTSPPSGSPTGAGLGLDRQSRDLLGRWLSDSGLVHDSTFPLSIDLVKVLTLQFPFFVGSFFFAF